MGMPVDIAWRERLVSFDGENFPDIPRERWREMFSNPPALKRVPAYFETLVADLPEARRLRMYTLPYSDLRSSNGKGIPVYQIFTELEAAGAFLDKRPIVMASSGNSLFNAARGRRGFGVDKIFGVVDEKISAGKKAHPRFAGAELLHPEGGMTTIEYAHYLAVKNNWLEINQYEHWGSVNGHVLFTMPHIDRQLEYLGEMLGASLANPVVCSAAGTTSTIVATRKYSDMYKRGWHVIGAASDAEDQRVGGTRTVKSIRKEIKFPWEASLTEGKLITGVSLKEAMAASRKAYNLECLWGPSWGLQVVAGLKRFREKCMEGTIGDWINPAGIVPMVFPCMDGPFSYWEEYVNVLGDSLKQ